MKKIKLNKLEVRNSALTREQLKGIMGGDGSSSSSFYASCEQACCGKEIWSNCSIGDKYGTCKVIPVVTPGNIIPTLVCYIPS